MNVIVGIDPASPNASVTHLLGRLRFQGANALCASCAMPTVLPSDPMVGYFDDLAQDLIECQRDAAERANGLACAELRRLGVCCESVFELGTPASKLACLATDTKADLIAVGSHHQGTIECFLKGSVARALALHCPCSLLIAKGDVEPLGPIRGLFAYDASPFGDACIGEIIRLHPEGIEHLDLLIVDTPRPNRSPVTDLCGEGAFGLGPERRREFLLERANEAAFRLREAGFSTDAMCLSGEVVDTIRGVVVDHHIDLTIVGARGHGWVERSLFGSIALEEAVSENHSLLLLHPVEGLDARD